LLTVSINDIYLARSRYFALSMAGQGKSHKLYRMHKWFTGDTFALSAPGSSLLSCDDGSKEPSAFRKRSTRP